MDELLDLIYELESSSGRDKRAYIPNPKDGSLGGYQITPGAFRDIQRMFPGKWGKKKFKTVMLDDTQARDAAGDRIRFLEVDLSNTYGVSPTRDALLASYNQGAKGIASGNPEILAKAKIYVDKANDIKSKFTEALKPFDPEGEGYDLESARAAGLRPDATGHMPSREPRSGLMLKGRQHETWDLAIQADKRLGYRTIRKPDGRYYSVPIRR